MDHVILVYLLWYVHQFSEDRDDKKDQILVGVYGSRILAESAGERASVLHGFQDHPEWFEISEYELDRDYWTSGYIVQ